MQRKAKKGKKKPRQRHMYDLRTIHFIKQQLFFAFTHGFDTIRINEMKMKQPPLRRENS